MDNQLSGWFLRESEIRRVAIRSRIMKMKRRKTPLDVSVKRTAKVNSSTSSSSAESACDESKLPVFAEKEDLSESGRGGLRFPNSEEAPALNSSSISHSAKGCSSLSLTGSGRNQQQFDVAENISNGWRAWAEDILRSLAALFHETTAPFGNGGGGLIPRKDPIPQASSSSFHARSPTLDHNSIRSKKKTSENIFLMQKSHKSMSGILAFKKVTIALKRLRKTSEKTRSVRFIKRKHSIGTDVTPSVTPSLIPNRNEKHILNSNNKLNIENALKVNSKVLNEEIPNISHKQDLFFSRGIKSLEQESALPCILEKTNSWESAIQPLTDVTNRNKDLLKSLKSTNKKEPKPTFEEVSKENVPPNCAENLKGRSDKTQSLPGVKSNVKVSSKSSFHRKCTNNLDIVNTSFAYSSKRKIKRVGMSGLNNHGGYISINVTDSHLSEGSKSNRRESPFRLEMNDSDPFETVQIPNFMKEEKWNH